MQADIPAEEWNLSYRGSPEGQIDQLRIGTARRTIKLDQRHTKEISLEMMLKHRVVLFKMRFAD